MKTHGQQACSRWVFDLLQFETGLPDHPADIIGIDLGHFHGEDLVWIIQVYLPVFDTLISVKDRSDLGPAILTIDGRLEAVFHTAKLI